jgi:hypothetical protein
MNWMSRLSDGDNWTDIKIIPSTHNSAAIKPMEGYKCIPWFWAKCQNNSVQTQLGMGIRGFDLRLSNIEGGVYIGHTLISNSNFNDILKTMKSFLNDNPSEFIFMFIKPDWPTRNKWNFNNVQELWDNFKDIDDYTSGFDNTIFLDPNINIKEVIIKNLRGKLIIIPDGKFCPYRNTSLNKGVATLPMNFFNVCETWNKNTVKNAKETIIHFIDAECKMNNKNTNNEEVQIVNTNNNYNIIQINVVVNLVPPYFVSKYMNNWLIKNITNYKDKCLGFVSIDFANKPVVNSLLN